jgi:DNA-binding MarR family transcriptional regulator
MNGSANYAGAMTPGDTATAPALHPIPAAVMARSALLLVKLGATLFDRAGPVLDELGVSSREYVAMAVLHDDHPRSQQELGQFCNLAGPVVVTLTDELEAKGLVERRRSTEDRRRTEVVLTAKGERTLAQADAAADRLQAEMFSVLDGDARAQFDAAVRQVIEWTWNGCGSMDAFEEAIKH